MRLTKQQAIEILHSTLGANANDGNALLFLEALANAGAFTDGAEAERLNEVARGWLDALDKLSQAMAKRCPSLYGASITKSVDVALEEIARLEHSLAEPGRHAERPRCPRCASDETKRTRNYGRTVGNEWWCLKCGRRWEPGSDKPSRPVATCTKARAIEVLRAIPGVHIGVGVLDVADALDRAGPFLDDETAAEIDMAARSAFADASCEDKGTAEFSKFSWRRCALRLATALQRAGLVSR